MTIGSCMKRTVYSISSNATVRQAAEIFVERHIGLLPVVDDQGRPQGILRLADLLRLEMPFFINLIRDIDFVLNFGAVENSRPTPKQLDRPVTELMQPAFTVIEDCGLVRAYAFMLQHDLHDLPVVSTEGVLIGLASRVDIGITILSGWKNIKTEIP